MATYPANYLLLNAESTKLLQVVVSIDGVPGYFSTGTIFQSPNYGDAGLYYGEPGLYYGGLIARTDVKPYLSLDGSMTISQKIEPEQGRGSVSLLTLTFIDKDGYMSEVISPGVIVDEPIGNKEVRVYVGFRNSSFPEDYFVVSRGFISATTYMPGKVIIQMSDPNLKRKSQVFYTPTNKLSTGVNNSTTTIPVTNTDGFYQQILDINGNYDSSVTTYIQVDDEVMSYGPTDLSPTSVTVTRAQRGTTAASHSSGADVSNTIQLQGNLIDLALKIMLSGWDGPFKSGVSAISFVDTEDPVLGNNLKAILLAPGIDAVLDIGLVGGEAVTVSGSSAGNDGTYKIVSISSSNGIPNNLLITDHNFNLESPATGVTLAFRSAYDTLPIACGSGLSQVDVDIERHVQLKNSFLSQAEYTMQFYITEAQSAKTFIESELYLPVGAYSITRFGQCSIALTIPPIGGERLTVLNKSNIIDITSMQVIRATNNRKFFNEIDYYYDATDAGDFANKVSFLDTTSLNLFDISSVLPIKSKGLRTSLSATNLINRRGEFLLNRYKNCALQVVFKVPWSIASTTEAGDIVAVQDNGDLHIINFSNGSRNLGTQLFEVIDRQLDIKSGNGSLTLLGSVGAEATDRFATISPSSVVGTGSTTTRIVITDSFSAAFPGNEKAKWTDAIGLPIFVHTTSYGTISNEVTLTGFDPSNPYVMLVSPALSYTPSAGDVVEIAKYPTSTDATEQAFYKLVYCHIDLTATVVTGISTTQFTVSSGDAANMNEGQLILIHNSDYSIFSPEVTVTTITGTTITVDSSLGFTPSVGQKIELNGFKDSNGGNTTGNSYRII